MAVHEFEVTEMKCVDHGDGEQGIMFVGQNHIVTLVMDKQGRRDHDKEICNLHRLIWNAGRRPFTLRIQQD